MNETVRSPAHFGMAFLRACTRDTYRHALTQSLSRRLRAERPDPVELKGGHPLRTCDAEAAGHLEEAQSINQYN